MGLSRYYEPLSIMEGGKVLHEGSNAVQIPRRHGWKMYQVLETSAFKT